VWATTLFYRRGAALPGTAIFWAIAREELRLLLAVLAEREPEAEDYLGGAEEAHEVRVLGEEAGCLADALGADLPEKRVFPGGDQLDYSVSDGDDGEGLK